MKNTIITGMLPTVLVSLECHIFGLLSALGIFMRPCLRY